MYAQTFVGMGNLMGDYGPRGYGYGGNFVPNIGYGELMRTSLPYK
jgi:hypothetical protein